MERKAAAKRGALVLAAFEEREELPGSVEGLIAYAGFWSESAWRLPIWFFLAALGLLLVLVFFAGILGFWSIASLR